MTQTTTKTTATATQNADGTWKIEIDGKIIRKNSKKLFPCVYTFGGFNHVLSNDGQLRRHYGEAVKTQIDVIVSI